MKRPRSTGRPTGRPSTYNPERAAAVLEFLELGCDEREACELARCSRSSFRRWVRDDLDGLYDRHRKAQMMRGLVWRERIFSMVDSSMSEGRFRAEFDRCERHCRIWLPLKLL